MEKINLEKDKEYSAAELAIECANKINNMIGRFDIVFESLRRKDDRLKTLEEDNALQKKMIKFIMKNSKPDVKVESDEFGKLKVTTLQDLWDEQNEEHLEKELIKEFIEPTVKECDCGDICVCGKRTAKLDKSEKIEEIMYDFNKEFGYLKKILELPFNRFESWLRDKLKEF